MFIFPGQGSQVVGMGKSLYSQFAAARAVYDLADEILGFSLSKLCFEGPEDELVQTKNAQPAIAVTSLALLKVAAEVSPRSVRGPHLWPATRWGVRGVDCGRRGLSFEDGVRLLRLLRGDLMQAAADRVPGTMAAIIGLDIESCQQAVR